MRRGVLVVAVTAGVAIAAAVAGWTCAPDGRRPLAGHLGDLDVSVDVVAAIAHLDGVDVADRPDALLVKHWLRSHLAAERARAVGLDLQTEARIAWLRAFAEDVVLSRALADRVPVPTEDQLRATWSGDDGHYLRPGQLTWAQGTASGPLDDAEQARLRDAVVQTASDGHGATKRRGLSWSVSLEDVALPTAMAPAWSEVLLGAPVGQLVPGPPGPGPSFAVVRTRTLPSRAPFEAVRDAVVADTTARLQAERDAVWAAQAPPLQLDAAALARGDDRVGQLGDTPVDLVFDRATQLLEPTYRRVADADGYREQIVRCHALHRVRAAALRAEGVPDDVTHLAAAVADLVVDRYLATRAPPAPDEAVDEAAARAWYDDHRDRFVPPPTASYAVARLDGPEVDDDAVAAALHAAATATAWSKQRVGDATVAVERHEPLGDGAFSATLRNAPLGEVLSVDPEHRVLVFDRSAATPLPYEEVRAACRTAVRTDTVTAALAHHPWVPVGAGD